MNLNHPRHVAIILDGNRRFAKRLMLKPWKCHDHGKNKVEDILNYAKSLGIREMTFYALSIENINSRPKKELDYLYEVFKEAFKKINREKIKENKMKFKFIGDLSLLPQDLRNECFKLEKETKDNNEFLTNFAIAYGGRQEIIRAVKKILNNNVDPKDVNESLFEENLYIKSQPDIVIRTGGEMRTLQIRIDSG